MSDSFQDPSYLWLASTLVYQTANASLCLTRRKNQAYYSNASMNLSDTRSWQRIPYKTKDVIAGGAIIHFGSARRGAFESGPEIVSGRRTRGAAAKCLEYTADKDQ